MDVTHDSVNGRLSELVDGELDAADAAAVQAHLFECPECRTTLQDLRTIAQTAGRLEGALPTADLWAGVARRIAAPPAETGRGWLGLRRSRVRPDARRRFSFTLPQLAAAGVLMMLLSGGMVFLLRPGAPATPQVAEVTEPAADDRIVPVSLSDPQYDDAVADLERTLERGRGRLHPETVRVLEQNLAAIDAAIEQCRTALEGDPANTFLTSHLVSARQRKLALLRRATALTTGS